MASDRFNTLIYDELVFDGGVYRNRNVVERSFAYLKQWRGLATRYDKLAITYRAAVVISAILTWLRQWRRRALADEEFRDDKACQREKHYSG